MRGSELTLQLVCEEDGGDDKECILMQTYSIALELTTGADAAIDDARGCIKGDYHPGRGDFNRQVCMLLFSSSYLIMFFSSNSDLF